MSLVMEMNMLQDKNSDLPPVIETNPRVKILPEKIDVEELHLTHESKYKNNQNKYSMFYRNSGAGEQIRPDYGHPVPSCPICISWYPDVLKFDIDDDEVINKLWVMNRSDRLLYVEGGKFWNNRARTGASWSLSPHTRYLVAPGLKVEYSIKAIPKPYAPFPEACACLQMAASHKRDNVTGYFAVPMKVNFLKYIPECHGEMEEYEDSV